MITICFLSLQGDTAEKSSTSATSTFGGFQKASSLLQPAERPSLFSLFPGSKNSQTGFTSASNLIQQKGASSAASILLQPGGKVTVSGRKTSSGETNDADDASISTKPVLGFQTVSSMLAQKDANRTSKNESKSHDSYHGNNSNLSSTETEDESHSEFRIGSQSNGKEKDHIQTDSDTTPRTSTLGSDTNRTTDDETHCSNSEDHTSKVDTMHTTPSSANQVQKTEPTDGSIEKFWNVLFQGSSSSSNQEETSGTSASEAEEGGKTKPVMKYFFEQNG